MTEQEQQGTDTPPTNKLPPVNELPGQAGQEGHRE
jgi:hypothetical protein